MNQKAVIDNLKFNKTRYYFLLAIFYCISYSGLFFLKDSVFYDDWVLVDANKETLVGYFRFAGSFWTGYLHDSLLKIGPEVYRLITFILMFLSGILFDLLLIKTEKFKIEDRFFLVCVFLTCPVNIARTLMINLPYTICYFLFFLAWYLKSFNNFLSLSLFFVSFTTNSLLCFYFFPIAYFYYLKHDKLISLKRIYFYISQNLNFIFLPIVFFLAKNIFLKPYGLFEGYNQDFSIISLVLSPIKQFLELFSLVIPNMGLLIILTILSYILLKKNKLFASIDSLNWNKNFFIILTITALFFACFPYWILGHVPMFADWRSRHQLLMPLGISFACFTFSLYLHKANKRIFTAILLSVFLVLNINSYYSLAGDWHKQDSLIKLISADNQIKNSEYIVFDDYTKKNNAFNRTFSFYEWNGILTRAFSSQKRLGVNLHHNKKEFEFIDTILHSSCKEYYKMGDVDTTNGLIKSLVEIKEFVPINNSFKDKLIRRFRGNLDSKYILNTYKIDDTSIDDFSRKDMKDICAEQK